MTRIVPDRAAIGGVFVFRLIGMGLGWPRDQMAGSVRRWRRRWYIHFVASHRDRSIDKCRDGGRIPRNQYTSQSPYRLIGRSCLHSGRNNTGSLLIIGHASKALPWVPASFNYSSSDLTSPSPSLSSRHQPLHPIIKHESSPRVTLPSPTLPPHTTLHSHTHTNSETRLANPSLVPNITIHHEFRFKNSKKSSSPHSPLNGISTNTTSK